MALFKIDKLVKVNKFQNAPPTKPLAYMGVLGNIGAGVSVGGLYLGHQMKRSMQLENRAIVTTGLHAGTIAPSTSITRLSSLGASGPEISAELEHFTTSGTPEAERVRLGHKGIYDLKNNQTEVQMTRGPIATLLGYPGEFSIVPRTTGPSADPANGATTASIHQPRFTTGQSQPLQPIYSKPYTGDRTLFSPLNLIVMGGAFLSSFALFNMISNKIYNGVWITPKPLTVFEIIEQLNLKKLSQSQASQLLEKYHDYSLPEAVSVLTGKKVSAETINLNQEYFDANGIDEAITKKLSE